MGYVANALSREADARRHFDALSERVGPITLKRPFAPRSPTRVPHPPLSSGRIVAKTERHRDGRVERRARKASSLGSRR